MKESLTSVIAAGDFLDFDNICTHVSKKHSAGWTSKNSGEIEDSDARKWGRNALVVRLSSKKAVSDERTLSGDGAERSISC